MSRHFGRTAPLGLVVEELLGVKSPGEGYTRAYANWVTIHFLSAPGSLSSKPFELRSKLTAPQANSYEILSEWWSAAIQEQSQSQRMVLAIEVAAGLGNLPKSEIEDQNILALFDRQSATAFHPLEIGVTQNVYNDAIYELFLKEFFYYENFDERLHCKLRAHRQRCAMLAINQRIAFSCLRSLIERPNPTNDSVPVSLTSQNEQQASDSRPRRQLSASIEVCSWLAGREEGDEVETQRKHGLPFYLFDRLDKKTVEVADLENPPEYVVISHTWGRWIKQTDSGAEAPPLSIPGVCDWEIPENTKFDVRELPNMLQNVPHQVQYIWIDLLCIPQKTTKPRLLEIAQDEIARQAEIFRGAAGGLIWFNDIHTWDGLERTVEWLGLNFFIASDDSHKDFEDFREAAFEFSDVPIGFFPDSPEHEDTNGWFSSLWTLQEALLRPDMLLVDTNWRVATVGETPILVTLEALVALIEGYVDVVLKKLPEKANAFDRISLEEQYKDMEFPLGYIELSNLFWSTGMDQMLNASSITPMILGNERYCRSSRAEAIMSVIGATEWYQGGTKQFVDAPEENLVLGKFPLPFLKEIQKKYGATLFNSLHIGLEGPPSSQSLARGSLLPFSSRPSTEALGNFRSPWHSIEVHDHPSIESWEIQQDGSVFLSEVGLIASSGEPDLGEGIPADVIAPVVYQGDKESTIHRTKSLRHWLCDYAPGHAAHAVCLLHGESYCEGILLIATALKSEVYLKVGNYIVNNVVELTRPSATKVNWKVL